MLYVEGEEAGAKREELRGRSYRIYAYKYNYQLPAILLLRLKIRTWDHLVSVLLK